MDNPVHDKQFTVLIVDDLKINRALLAEMLDAYNIIEAGSGSEAVEIMRRKKNDIDLVLLDIVMPDMDGFEVLTVMRNSNLIDRIPVIMVSSDESVDSIEHAYELGASDYITRHFVRSVVLKRVENTIMLYNRQKQLISTLKDQIFEKEQDDNILVNVLGHIVEFRNGESGPHIRNIRLLTAIMLKHLSRMHTKYSFGDMDILTVSKASALHDIGKISIDDKILNKPGKLTPEEFEIVKRHTVIGADMINAITVDRNKPFVKYAHDICRWHHERYDGGGYPDGLVGDEIPIAAQVVSIADVYDALTSDRCYKRAIPHSEAIRMIRDGECGAFNPLLIECLNEFEKSIPVEMRDLGDDPDYDLLSGITYDFLTGSVRAQSPKKLSDSISGWDLIEFFSRDLKEIRFVYDAANSVVELSSWGAEYLGLNQTVVHPYEKDQSFLGRERIDKLARRLRALPPEIPEISEETDVLRHGKRFTCRIIARAVFADTPTHEYLGVIGRLIDLEDL